MYKALKLRSRDEFLANSERIARGNPKSKYHPGIMVPYMESMPFKVTAVLTCGVVVAEHETKVTEARQWLQDNATGKFYLDSHSPSIGFRIYFEDEGDAFRFTWMHERPK